MARPKAAVAREAADDPLAMAEDQYDVKRLLEEFSTQIRGMIDGLSTPEAAAALGRFVAAISEHIPTRSAAIPSMPTEAGHIPVSVPINLPARVIREEDGSYSAEVPALPGCFTCGETLEETQANIREAAEGWLLAKQDLETGAIKLPAPPGQPR